MYCLHSYIPTITALLLVGSGIASAQDTAGVCLNSTGYGWATNKVGQDPCIVANDLFTANPAPCDDNGVTFPPLTATTGPASYYTGPGNTSAANPCLCNTVIYSLLSACGLCQNGTFLYWSEWTDNCAANETLYQQWPASIPSNTEIAPWAYMPLVNGFWDGPQAQGNACNITASPSPGASTTQTPSNDSTSGNHTGAIVGGVIGGLVGLAALGFLGVFFWRRRSQTIAYQTTPMHDMSDQYHDKSVASHGGRSSQANLAKVYDPSDPSTFPRSPAPRSQLTGTTVVHSNPGFGQYTGAPEL
ncbi:hypothetical protein BV22DRAFT_1163577 [Leucogyrophana mollusca]|uniref:Uncharacterized protein n=1 Tax=Leucogyrophana mollusca TaxID=85980 RepID=A0ACB8BHD1_9AGAM|nr:hypothetical protein BV22DRAFT_1163577 [Leucogyrophana mollusca]